MTKDEFKKLPFCSRVTITDKGQKDYGLTGIKMPLNTWFADVLRSKGKSPISGVFDVFKRMRNTAFLLLSEPSKVKPNSLYRYYHCSFLTAGEISANSPSITPSTCNHIFIPIFNSMSCKFCGIEQPSKF